MNKNRYVCHSCRNPGHWLEDFPFKRQCPRCENGYMKWLHVYRTKNVGKLFYNCTAGCDYFEWDNVSMNFETEEGESSGSSSNKRGGVDETIELSRILKMFTAITEDSNLKMSVTLTIGKGDCSSEEKGKGKEKM